MKTKTNPLGKIVSLIERWNKFTQKTTPDECWQWMGQKSKGGYGRIRFGGKWVQATHVAILIARREIVPAGMVAMHLCDNPNCVNPHHLVVGTQTENMLDCYQKSRR